MSQLKNALDRIKTWLTNNCPVVAENITPGLNSEEIQAIVKVLPFSLPEEIYEFYQWSRGHYGEALNSIAFDPYEVMFQASLEYAIELYSTLERADADECITDYINRPLFPIFDFNSASLCVIGNWDDKKSSPIILVSNINQITTRYTNLTSMMLTVAESFESGAFSLEEDGYTAWNEEVFSHIYVKYNSNILEFSIARLKQELINRQHSVILSGMTKSNFEGDICYLGRERLYLETNQFDIEMLQPLITAMQDENKIVRDLAKRALEELNYDFE
jgi:hypothetical protein